MNARFKAIPTNIYLQSVYVKTEDAQCGLLWWKPKWLQKFAVAKVYYLILSALCILQGAYFTYFIGVMSTLEKRFAFESHISATILIAGTLSPLFVICIGGKLLSSRLFFINLLLAGLGCLMSGLLYSVYGPGVHILHKNIGLQPIQGREFCDSSGEFDACTEKRRTYHWVAFLFFLMNFLIGFGYTVFYKIGLPFVDEITKKDNSRLHIGAMAALRIFGPTLGFLLASFCLEFYEDPFYDPGIDSHNPRWVGAWWMGFIILGVALLFFTFLLALFPRELPARFRSEKKSEEDKDKEPPKLKDFPKSVRKLMKNPILVCHVISITFQVNGFFGYFVFMPKFMESQYHQSASDASLFSGVTGIVSMLLGILIGGFMIKKYKPRPKYLTGYMVLVEIFSVVGLFISIFLGCPPIQMPGTSTNADEVLNLYNECNVDCSCTRRVFEPVCGPDGVSTYFSPCFAGCSNASGLVTSAATTVATTIANATVFHNCKCLPDTNSTYITSSVTSGFCITGCTMFMTYIIMLCISKFISSTARVGDTLVTLRCVEAEDKSFALGAFGSVLAVFAFIPYPLIYGALTDSACLVWEESCSKTGNCWLYDSDKFRYYLHGMSMLLISIGICFDVVVFFLSDRMKNFYGEDDEDNATNDRLARWIKEEEDEDIIFTMCPIKEPTLEMDPII